MIWVGLRIGTASGISQGPPMSVVGADKSVYLYADTAGTGPSLATLPGSTGTGNAAIAVPTTLLEGATTATAGTLAISQVDGGGVAGIVQIGAEQLWLNAATGQIFYDPASPPSFVGFSFVITDGLTESRAYAARVTAIPDQVVINFEVAPDVGLNRNYLTDELGTPLETRTAEPLTETY